MSGWLDEDRPGSGPVEGDGRSIDGVLHIYRDGRWVPNGGPVTAIVCGGEDLSSADRRTLTDWIEQELADEPR